MSTNQPFFQGSLMPPPEPTYRSPRFSVTEEGRPCWELIDTMGVAHKFHDFAIIRDARFEGWSLAGFLVRDAVFDTVCFAGCKLSNAEFVSSKIRRLVINGEGGEGGPVFSKSTVDSVKIEELADGEAVVRFHDCEMLDVLITDCACGIDIARSQSFGLVLQRSTFESSRVVAIRSATLRGSRIIDCSFSSALLYQANMFETTIRDVEFSGSRLDVDMSLSDIADLGIQSCFVNRLSLDAAICRGVKIFDTHAYRVTANFSEIVDVEIKGGLFDASFEQTTLRSVMFLKVVTYLALRQSQAFGLRLCCVRGTIRGAGTTVWVPVIRQSELRGNEKPDITFIDAICTGTKFVNKFGTWIDQHIQQHRNENNS